MASPWLPCLGLGEGLSCKISVVSPPGGPTSPGCFRSRALQAPSPAAGSHTQGCSDHHSAPQCFGEAAGLAAARCSSGSQSWAFC